MVEHFLESFATESRITLHVTAEGEGSDDSERATAVMEAVGKAVGGAMAKDQRREGKVASSKGTLDK